MGAGHPEQHWAAHLRCAWMQGPNQEGALLVRVFGSRRRQGTEYAAVGEVGKRPNRMISDSINIKYERVFALIRPAQSP